MYGRFSFFAMFDAMVRTGVGLLSVGLSIEAILYGHRGEQGGSAHESIS